MFFFVNKNYLCLLLTIYNEKSTPEILTLYTTFYDLSVPRNLFSKTEMRQFGALGTEG